MSVQMMSRREAIELGLIDPNATPTPAEARVSEAIKASANGMSDADLREISRDLQTEIKAHDLMLKQIGYDTKTGRYLKK